MSNCRGDRSPFNCWCSRSRKRRDFGKHRSSRAGPSRSTCSILRSLSNDGTRTALSVWGGVELGLASAATGQLAHRYHLPVNVYGFSTNSMQLNLQNGYERGIKMPLLPALAGADELSGIGEMQAGVAGSYAQMVIDDEIAGSIRRACRGFFYHTRSTCGRYHRRDHGWKTKLSRPTSYR